MKNSVGWSCSVICNEEDGILYDKEDQGLKSRTPEPTPERSLADSLAADPATAALTSSVPLMNSPTVAPVTVAPTPLQHCAAPVANSPTAAPVTNTPVAISFPARANRLKHSNSKWPIQLFEIWVMSWGSNVTQSTSATQGFTWNNYSRIAVASSPLVGTTTMTDCDRLEINLGESYPFDSFSILNRYFKCGSMRE
jgi:hypothetical protein